MRQNAQETLAPPAATLVLAGAALAKYPDHPITIIVPWVAGGGTDAIAREPAQGLQKQLGVSISVVNRSGGAGVVGVETLIVWAGMIVRDVRMSLRRDRGGAHG